MSVQDQIADAALDVPQQWALVKQCRNSGEIQQALDILTGLCARHPGDFRFALCMSELLVQEGRFEDSIEPLARARRIGAPDVKTADLLGRLEVRRELLALERDHKPSELIARYHEIIRERPDFARRIAEMTPVVNRAGEDIYRREAPPLGKTAQGVIDEVRERGIAIRPLAEITQDPDILAELQAVVRGTEDWTVPGKPHFFKAMQEEAAVASHPIMRAALLPEFLEIANGFYGLYTRVVSANIVQTRTDGSAERQRRGSEGWHRDPEDQPMFKIFVYLNDVLSVDHGPFQYVPDSRVGGKYAEIFPQFGQGIYDPTLKFKPNPVQVDTEVAPDDVVTVLGRAGTMFFCDTSGFHRGGYCLTQDRYMLANVYQRPGSQFPSYIKAEVPADASTAVRMALQPL